MYTVVVVTGSGDCPRHATSSRLRGEGLHVCGKSSMSRAQMPPLTSTMCQTLSDTVGQCHGSCTLVTKGIAFREPRSRNRRFGPWKRRQLFTTITLSLSTRNYDSTRGCTFPRLRSPFSYKYESTWLPPSPFVAPLVKHNALSSSFHDLL